MIFDTWDSVLSSSMPLADGLVALVLPVALQWPITWSLVRFSAVANLVKSKPRLLLHQGCLRHEARQHERVTGEEVHAALRTQGIGRIAGAAAVV